LSTCIGGKTLKAALVMKDIIIATKYTVSEDFFDVHQSWEGANKDKNK
jgi:hypothetical protein